jgi:hypothetical protein
MGWAMKDEDVAMLPFHTNLLLKKKRLEMQPCHRPHELYSYLGNVQPAYRYSLLWVKTRRSMPAVIFVIGKAVHSLSFYDVFKKGELFIDM